MQVLRRFKADQRGATAMLFGLTALPLLGIVGAAVDYSRAANFQSRMQLAVDATALSIVREPPSLTAREIQARGELYLTNALRADATAQVGSVSVTRNGKLVQVAASATMDRSITRLLGLEPMPISANSHASSSRRLEIALVLDNTYSMSESLDDGTRKMDALKTEVRKTLDSLAAMAAEPGRAPDSIKVSIVPFDTEVRLDAAKVRNESWFDWQDGASPSKWSGYVYDRPGSYGRSDRAPNGSKDSLFPAPRVSECSRGGAMACPSDADLPVIQPLVSVSQNLDRLKGIVKSMAPRGYTNIAIGAVWGQSTLSRSQPFTEGSDADESVEKIMLVLTDGLNTAHHVNGKIEKSTDPRSAIVAGIDANTRAACESAKASGTRIFTVRVKEGDEDLLRSCASSPADYVNVQSGGDFSAAFKTFLDKITKTRITS